MITMDKVGYAVGYLQATVGSPNDYTPSQLRSKMRYVAAILEGDKDAWRFLDGQTPGDDIHISLDKTTRPIA